MEDPEQRPAPLAPIVPELPGQAAWAVDQPIIIAEPPPGAETAPPSPSGAVQQLGGRIAHEMGKAVVGQGALIEMLTVAVLSGGHVLLEGVPGTAKTLTVRALARVFDTSFARIQFTPDLMPSDLLGTNVFDQATQRFNLKRGPLFAGLVLADEINRTPPKTQAALLEAMEERQVTIDGFAHPLPAPFMVCATQNPVEFEGTYPLPEAQLDRFMLKVAVGYPSESEESDILQRTSEGFRSQDLATANIAAVLTAGDLAEYQAEVARVVVTPDVRLYIVQIARATRANRHVTLGASPRAALTHMLAARALAALKGRGYVTPDDVKQIARPVLQHRLLIKPESEIEGHTVAEVVDSALESVAVPR